MEPKVFINKGKNNLNNNKSAFYKALI